MRKLFFPLCCALLLVACGDDDITRDPYAEELNLEIVTGLQCRDANGAPVSTLGNPNVRSGEVDIFPNPSNGDVLVQYFGGASLQVRQYWVFAAEQNTDYAAIDYQAVLTGSTYSADEVSDLNSVQTNIVNQSAFALDLSNLMPGYYRIFYLMGDETLLWDNLYVDPSATDFFSLLSTVNEDW